jgi:hypothetical protein
MQNIWILKGVFLGLAVFFVGALGYLVSKLGPISAHKATSITLLRSLTIGNSWFWICLVAALVMGCLIARQLSA